jgi:hypothetical protein
MNCASGTNDRLKGRPALICSREAATVAPGLRITAHLSGSRRRTSAPATAFCYTGEEPNDRAVDWARVVFVMNKTAFYSSTGDR